ncbi:Ada metal-binding domain-containing protein [Scleromatobacter humisilvae]|uniref:DNA-3-methyladenine glycosylase II n=1 Tax=Scleromatobacter humisilvae TaxID=2897159 RepID=A0A9X1YTN6_9BURK|nr:Ada metal-binding domain-containing protein [Scleromatobacter humisilvae]MCK9689721.1 helix-turn-helix domain-containing protein [Scleromatobacter humisilvae]
MELDPDIAWKALAAHDARFDGRFFVGVTSTRIYCRPVCRVRTPRRENCRFYANAATAEQAGFRPCLRCRPELAPGLSLMDSSQVLAQHAARMIDHAVRVGAAVRMPELAARLGVTERHLRRVFAQAHGVSPIDYLTTQRLLQAKQLLTDTDLPVTEVALACGFESLRRFNAVFAEQVRLKPTELRGAARSSKAGGDGLRVRLGYRPPYDVASMLAFWEQRVLAGVEEVSGRVIRRTWSAPRPAVDESGHAGAAAEPARGWIEIEFLEERHEVELRASANLAAHSGQLVEAARHALDLDADPTHMAPLLATLAELHPASAMTAGLRMPGSFDGFETAARIVLGQQVTVAAARTLTRRLIERFGAPVETPWPGLTRCFPDAATIAAATPDSIGELGIVRQRVAALQGLARAVVDGLPLHRGAPLASTQDTLLALPGIGDWTTQLLALRVLGWPDAFPATDIGLLKALGLAQARDAPQAIAMAESWRPWRSYAVIALWRALESDDPSPAPAPVKKRNAVRKTTAKESA